MIRRAIDDRSVLPQGVEGYGRTPNLTISSGRLFWPFLVSFSDCSERQLFFTYFIPIFIYSIFDFQFQRITMLEEWIPSLGIGVMVSGFLAFIVGVANCAEAWKENSLEMKKNRLEMEQSKVKLQLEIMKAYREVLKEVREIEKHNWGREEAGEYP